MKKIFFLSTIIFIIVSCGPPLELRSVAYKGMYEEKPLSVLIMPPINRSTAVDAKEYFHSTLNVPIANAGYYVIPPFLSMEILKKESAYDSELFLDIPLKKFEEVFGADVIVFTIIHKWDKNKLLATVKVDVEYIIKSVKTNQILYTRRGQITYDASVDAGNALASLIISAINTAVTDYVPVARACNAFTLFDLPRGNYSPLHMKDGAEKAGRKTFKATVGNVGYY